jgi:hypothetical protein
MPTTLPEGMVLSTILERESPKDAVVIRKDLADKGSVYIYFIYLKSCRFENF